MKLSIIIISKNEEKVIQKAIHAAVIAGKKCFADNDFEIILVDSNSDDTTISKAKDAFLQFNVKNWRIIQYKSKIYTAALGRQIGLENARGDYILFLDGDMLVFSSFIASAIKYFKDSPKNVSCIVGKRMDVYLKGKRINRIKAFKKKKKHGNIDLAPGGCLFCLKKKIDNVRFNTIQKTREEEAFAKQLYSMGNVIVYVDKYMYLHINYKAVSRTISEKINLIKQGSKDDLISIKNHIKEFGLLSVFYLYKEILIFYIMLPLILLLLLLLIIVHHNNLLSLLIITIPLALLVYRNKLGILRMVFTPLYFFLYLFIKPKYNVDYEIVKDEKSESWM